MSEPAATTLSTATRWVRGITPTSASTRAKGRLYLFNPQGEIVDHVSFPKMPAPNVAYGRVADGAAEWGYELNVTPRGANGGGVTSVILPDPVFSVKGNADYNVRRLEEVTVSIPQGVSLPADTRLYITTDGSEPEATSESYDSEVTLRSSVSMVVRAKAYFSRGYFAPLGDTFLHLSSATGVAPDCVVQHQSGLS